MRARPSDLEDLDATNAAFRAEATQYNFHYRCGSCVHVHRATKLCSLGYPNDTLKGDEVVAQPDGHLTFCKYFEVGEFIAKLEG